MSKSFNSGGVAASSCVFLAGVDSDNSTVKDFSPTAATLTLDGGGSAPANGTYGYGFQLTKSSNNMLGYTVTGGPTINGGSGNTNSLFLVLNQVAVAATSTGNLLAQSTSTGFSAASLEFSASVGSGLQPIAKVAGFTVNSGTSLTTGTAHTIAIVAPFSGTVSVYIDGTLANSASSSGNGANSQALGRLGGVNGQGSVALNICYLAYFKAYGLTATDVTNLHNSCTGSGAFSLITIGGGSSGNIPLVLASLLGND